MGGGQLWKGQWYHQTCVEWVANDTKRYDPRQTYPNDYASASG